ncbi:MAG: AAA family ATPase [Flammeovirgaceae bacterium]
MKKLPIGIQDFRELRKKELLYVDKTPLLHTLVHTAKYFFLSRPRRFGKSLLLSTLAELFKGNKAIFQGLWIENQWEWTTTNPVIELRFNEAAYKYIGLGADILRRLREQAKLYQIELEADNYVLAFREFILALSAKFGQVVVLIDEYDKPIIDFLHDIPQAEENREVLKNFYSVLKPLDAHIRFVFITGVSKFSRVSIFSELNNLKDLTMSKPFHDLCGYTQQELEQNFQDGIAQLCEEFDKDKEWALAEIKRWYNGYSWGNTKNTLYNPFSILNLFDELQFRNYWFETGTPTFLIKLLRKKQQYDLERIQATSSALGSYQLANISSTTLLFQTGYLTIKADLGIEVYELGYPNQEVKSSMLRFLMDDYTNADQGHAAVPALLMVHALWKGKTEELRTHVNALLASIPYELHQSNEAYYHTVMYLAFSLIGVHIQSEIHVAKGRLDAILTTDQCIYIFEFKVNSSAEQAIQQIKEKGYAQPYLGKGKVVIAIGISFNTELKEVDDWRVEELP